MVYRTTTGMNALNDQIIAADLLISAKSSIKCTSMALTEVTSQNVRTVLKQQLDDAISFHEQVSNYAMTSGMYYDPYNVNEQIKKEMQSAQNVMNLQG